MAEGIQERLEPVLGWKPKGLTEIVLTDQTDSANGSATALPYNQIRLYLTAPDDLSPLGDVDDWYLELLTHEHTHVLHTDQIRGVPALFNALIGKTFSPNQAQPRWVLEGLAILQESARTAGGRLRSSQWRMYLRADTLEDNLATLDQFTNTPRRWPQGNLWYLYGSFFLRWIADVYGEDALRKMVREMSFQIVPWGINRMIRRVTGKTFEELYPMFVADMQRRFAAERDAIRVRGLREGTRLTWSGQIAMYPRFVPAGAFGGRARAGDLVFQRDDAHTLSGLWHLPLARDGGGGVTAAAAPELVVRGGSSAGFLPDGGVVFDALDTHRNLFSFVDLHRLPPGEVSPTGLDPHRVRLTDGWRASQPDVSPDGRRVAFVSNHRGTSYLQVADLAGDHLDRVRNVVTSVRFEQAFAPRWSPDNRHLAYSVWQRGGARDVRIVDTEDGSFVNVTRDRAIDGGPCWSPDGTRLYFHSDRTGVMNVFAHDVRTGALAQVTNVVNGAYQPAVSPDGKTLVYVGYTHRGFDLFAMPIDEPRFLEATPYVDDRPQASPVTTAPGTRRTPSAYNPLHTLRPRAYSVSTSPGNYGQSFSASVAGADIALQHFVDATLTVESDNPELQPSVGYTYARLPVDLGFRVYRAVTPRTGGFVFGKDDKPRWDQDSVVLQSSVSYPLPRAFDTQSFTLSYSATRTGVRLPQYAQRLDPYETPAFPTGTFLTFLTLSWSYTNARRFLWSVGHEQGFSASAYVSATHPALASEYTAYSAGATVTHYFLMPWLRHHALGLAASANTSGGNSPNRSTYFVGGFVDVPLFDTVRNVLVQGGIVLRGYPVGVLSGRSSALLNAEYRFPILNVDRGPSTAPFFFNRVTGAVFVDYGSAFDDAATARFKTGVGAELWFDMQVAYFLSFTFRAGYARGLASGGIDKPYFVAAVPF